jgi:hypothetical protein
MAYYNFQSCENGQKLLLPGKGAVSESGPVNGSDSGKK